jgi:dodecin
MRAACGSDSTEGSVDSYVSRSERTHQMGSVYRVIEVIGTSDKSWEDAAATAVATASGTVRDLRVAEVTKLDVTIGSDGKVESYRARVDLSFKYEGG